MYRPVVPNGLQPNVSIDPADLFERHCQSVYAYAARRLGPSLAQDIVAETFRIALQQIESFDPLRGSERGWLFGISSNLIRRHWRTEQRRLTALARNSRRHLEEDDFSPMVEARLHAKGRVEHVLRAIGRLAPEDRDLLILIAWEGLSNREAADALGLPAGTVASRLHRIRTCLRQGEPRDY